ncbi:hypothetical protein BYT27DRAFT_7241568 [Phlegmacium glaucopus]|nr:hypothetical protein BYT27DRAFT_7241568 [Phlegmacium glaucopus]
MYKSKYRPSLDPGTGRKTKWINIFGPIVVVASKKNQSGGVIDLDEDGNPTIPLGSWVAEGKLRFQTIIHQTACRVGGVLGEMIAHILGKNGHNPCTNIRDHAQKTAREEKMGKTKKKVKGGLGQRREGTSTVQTTKLFPLTFPSLHESCRNENLSGLGKGSQLKLKA